MTDINHELNRLINFALKNNLIDLNDVTWAANNLIGELNLNNFDFSNIAIHEYEAAVRNDMEKMFDGTTSLTSITCDAANETKICDAITNSENVGINTPVSINGNRLCQGYIPAVY